MYFEAQMEILIPVNILPISRFILSFEDSIEWLVPIVYCITYSM